VRASAGRARGKAGPGIAVSLGVYRALASLAGPALTVYLARRRRQGREDADPLRYGERFGRASRPRPPGPLVWLHAASVGEANSVQSLIGRLLETRGDLSVLLTTGTVTSARLMGERLPARAFHQYVPVDRPAWVARFLDHWRPDAALWVESELWPNLIAATRARAIPTALINARLSARSFARWRRLKRAAASMLAGFDPCLAQSEAEAVRLVALGAREARCVGNLKHTAPPPPDLPAARAELAAAIDGRPVWLAASTHPGEEEMIAAAHRRIAKDHRGLVTIIVPRHAERGLRIAELPAIAGLGVARRSAGALPGPDTAIYVADTMGELGLFYRLAPVAFIGGSLVRHGGQNPLEAAQLGTAILHGPHMWNFAAIVDALAAAGGALPVADADALAQAAGRLLADAPARARQAAAARTVAEEGRGALDRVMAALAPLLGGLPPAARPDAAA